MKAGGAVPARLHFWYMNPALIRIASVSFLNARPLIWGLDRDPQIALTLDVPSRLIEHLRSGAADVALLPTIDYQRLDDLSVVPAGGIGSDGTTLTVRIFARRPIETIRTLACDTDSHTSVALARIILAERHGISPEIIELRQGRGGDDEARLLIGDKVIAEEPQGFGFQYDLGEEWKRMTGLPFVFAVWTARGGVDLGDLPQRLAAAREAGLRHVDAIVAADAAPRGWPAALARQYLTVNLTFDIGAAQLQAIALFHQLAQRHRLIPLARPLQIYGDK
jgi:chorismate dehydratase